MREVVTRGSESDLALMNDAQFQLGELFAVRGNFMEKGPKKDEVLRKPLEAYRNTSSKMTVIAAQQRRIEAAEFRQREAGVRGDTAALRKAQSAIQHAK